jgi:hypothetical protein
MLPHHNLTTKYLKESITHRKSDAIQSSQLPIQIKPCVKITVDNTQKVAIDTRLTTNHLQLPEMIQPRNKVPMDQNPQRNADTGGSSHCKLTI